MTTEKRLRYVYMSIYAPAQAGGRDRLQLHFNGREAAKGAKEVWRVPYGYSKDCHHHWDRPTFCIIGERIR